MDANFIVSLSPSFVIALFKLVAYSRRWSAEERTVVDSHNSSMSCLTPGSAKVIPRLFFLELRSCEVQNTRY